MAPILKEKKEFLAVYDYGMGGIWFVVSATSSEEVRSRFPFFKVFEKRPNFISQQEFIDIRKESFQNIDEPEIELISTIRNEWGMYSP